MPSLLEQLKHLECQQVMCVELLTKLRDHHNAEARRGVASAPKEFNIRLANEIEHLLDNLS